MTPEEIVNTLTESFESVDIQAIPSESSGNAPSSWQIQTTNFRLLVLLSDDEYWLRVLLPIISALAAAPFIEQLLEANFDDTQQVRYALHQEVVWGVFQHRLESLKESDFKDAIARLISLHQLGLSDLFNQQVENRMRQIIKAAKQQGQSLETTLQTLDRFYEEGILGDMDQSAESREQVLAAWQRRMESLWSEVEL